MGWIVFLQRYIEVLAPGNCEWDLVMKLGLCRYDQAKKGHADLEWALKSNDQSMYVEMDI